MYVGRPNKLNYALNRRQDAAGVLVIIAVHYFFMSIVCYLTVHVVDGEIVEQNANVTRFTINQLYEQYKRCLLYTSPSPRDS